MRPLPLLLIPLLACEPPPAISAEPPSIKILYPDSTEEIEADDCEGNLELLIVVQVDNLGLQSPYDEGVDLVAGEGHWHAFFAADPSTYTASFEPSVTAVLSGPFNFDLDVRPSLTVSLQDNLHEPLNAENTIEFPLVQPANLACP